MTVTSIQYTSDGAAGTVFLDGEAAAVLSADDIFSLGLFEGGELDDERAKAVRRRGDAHYALEKALATIDAMDITKARLARRLCEKGVAPELAEDTARFCEEHGLINDENYARNNVEYYAGTKLFGARRVLQELLKRGVPRDTALAAIDEYGADEAESIRRWLETKFAGRDLSDRREKQRAVDFLVRTGFSYSDIRDALAEWLEGAELSDYEY